MRSTIITLAVLAAALFCDPSQALAEKGAKKNTNGEHVVRGVVASVEHDKKGGQGSFVVKTQSGKKKNGANAANAANAGAAGKGQAGKEHTIHVGKHTKFETANGGKGAAGQGGFAHLKAGEHVSVTMKGDTAEKVVIQQHRSKGQKKT